MEGNVQECGVGDTTFAIDGQAVLGLNADNNREGAEHKRAWAVLYPISEGLHKFVCSDTTGKRFSFGRDDKCDVCLISTGLMAHGMFFRLVSCHHFDVCLGPGKVAYVTDVSTNGTFINGERLNKGVPRVLSHGDTISVASPSCVVYNFLFTQPDLYADGNDLFCEKIREKYVISHILGSGSYGEVRMAYSKNSTDRFAIKTLKKKDVRSLRPVSKKAQAKLRMEADILRSVHHPCITSIHETVETENHIYIIMEHIPGGELFDFILRNGAVKESKAKLVLYQVACAVKYLHDQNITHRDVKPENVLLTSSTNLECRVKLTDFGLSRLTNSYSAIMKTYCGTPTYLAPEVFGKEDGEIAYKCNVDVWSLGVLCFVTLTAQMLSDDDNESSDGQGPPCAKRIKSRVRSMAGANRFNWSKSLVQLLLKMLEVEPTKRYSSEDVAEHVWFTGDKVMLNKAYELTDGVTGQRFTGTLNASPKKGREHGSPDICDDDLGIDVNYESFTTGPSSRNNHLSPAHSESNDAGESGFGGSGHNDEAESLQNTALVKPRNPLRKNRDQDAVVSRKHLLGDGNEDAVAAKRKSHGDQVLNEVRRSKRILAAAAARGRSPRKVNRCNVYKQKLRSRPRKN